MPCVDAPSPSPRDSDTQYFVALALLTLSTAAVFGPVLRHEFIALDYDTYTGNPVIQRGLSWEGVRYAFTAVVASNWHPLTVLAHMTLHTLFGSDPFAHYAANLFIHWVNVVLVFEALRRATGANWRSALVAALFGLHPFRVESVAWTAELKDVLSACFALLAVLAYLRFTATRRWPWYALTAVLFALGLLAKASIVALPLLLLLLDYWPLARFRIAFDDRSSIVRPSLEKLPLLILAAAMAAITLTTFRGSTRELSNTFSLPTSLAMSAIAYKDYVLVTFWPLRLSPSYPFTAPTAPIGETAAAAVLLSAISAFVFIQRRTNPYFLFGWLWFLVAIFPVSGVLAFAPHYRADRYTYLAHIGLFTGVVWYVAALVSQRRPLMLASRAAAIAVTLLLSATSYTNLYRWRDNVSLFGYAVRVTPESSIVQTGFAIGLIQQRRLDEAEPHLREALRINPHDVQNMKRLASLLLLTARPEESVPVYESVVEAEPGRPENHAGLAVAYERTGEFARAEQSARQALTLDPEYPAALEIIDRLDRRASGGDAEPSP